MSVSPWQLFESEMETSKTTLFGPHMHIAHCTRPFKGLGKTRPKAQYLRLRIS